MADKTLNELKMKRRIFHTLAAYYTTNCWILENKEINDLLEQMINVSDEIYQLSGKLVNELDNKEGVD